MFFVANTRKLMKRQTSVYTKPATRLSMMFSTLQSKATLIQIDRNSFSSDSVILEVSNFMLQRLTISDVQINDGYLMLRLDLGGGETSTNILSSLVNDGQYHYISMIRYGSDTVLLLDNMYISRLSVNLTTDPLTYIFLDVSRIVLGGLIDSNGIFNNSFIGCIYGMRLDNYDLPISGQSDIFRVQPSNNQPVLPCNSTTESTPPTIIKILTTLYVIFGLSLICLCIISISFVSCCKCSHYIYTRNKKKYTVSSSNRFVDFPYDSSTIPRAVDHQSFRGGGLQSTASFEPIRLSRNNIDNTSEAELCHTPNSPSVISDSVFEPTATSNDYEPHIIQKIPNSVSPRPLNSVSPRPLNSVSPRPLNSVSSRPLNSVSSRPLNSVSPRLPNSVSPQPPEYTSVSRKLDPMTGMPISESPDMSTEQCHTSDEEMKSYISKRLEYANYQLENINYDSIQKYGDEGTIDLWELKELEFEHNSLLQELTRAIPEIVHSPTSPCKPSPLLQSRKWESPPKKLLNEKSFNAETPISRPQQKAKVSSLDNLHDHAVRVKPEVAKKPKKKPAKVVT